MRKMPSPAELQRAELERQAKAREGADRHMAWLLEMCSPTADGRRWRTFTEGGRVRFECV
jgi:hypothetical protein